MQDLTGTLFCRRTISHQQEQERRTAEYKVAYWGWFGLWLWRLNSHWHFLCVQRFPEKVVSQRDPAFSEVETQIWLEQWIFCKTTWGSCLFTDFQQRAVKTSSWVIASWSSWMMNIMDIIWDHGFHGCYGAWSSVPDSSSTSVHTLDFASQPLRKRLSWIVSSTRASWRT